jgi:uracil DNA glycosylase
LYTVRNHQANSHAKKGWEQFTDAVINTISQKKEGVIFLLWGNSAQEKKRYCSPSLLSFTLVWMHTHRVTLTAPYDGLEYK